MDLYKVTFLEKTAIITGGAKGIGKSVALQISRMGGKPIIVDIDEESLKATCEEIGNAEYYVIDMEETEDLHLKFQTIVDEHDKIDILINNAGVVSSAEFCELTLEEWNKIQAINLTSVFISSQVLFKHMMINGGGRIVNVASVVGKNGGGFLGTAAYAASKGGVISLTKSIARAGSQYNIYCNSICPAYTKTPFHEKTPQEIEDRAINAMSLHRVCEADEVANAILFMASDAASFIQGENLNVDGGMLMNG